MKKIKFMLSIAMILLRTAACKKEYMNTFSGERKQIATQWNRCND